MLELMKKDSKLFVRDFRGVERRYLTGEKKIEADDLIREPSELSTVALMSSSLQWLEREIKQKIALDDQCQMQEVRKGGEKNFYSLFFLKWKIVVCECSSQLSSVDQT